MAGIDGKNVGVLTCMHLIVVCDEINGVTDGGPSRCPGGQTNTTIFKNSNDMRFPK